jgi:transposase
MSRKEITDAQWRQIGPHLPPHAETGRPRKDDRTILNGILWVVRTGSPWRDLPEERYGPWETVYGRLRDWRLRGFWDEILSALQRAVDAQGKLDWSVHHVDGTVVRAHQHAAGGKKGTPARKH